MCGICGIAFTDPKQTIAPDHLFRMRETIEHRGPDGAGAWIHQNVGLGHRRLSIVDLEGGKQPLTNEDRTVWVTFNGEIYNYQELASELRQRGHQFRTRSDTEVLVHGYEEWGLDFIKRLNGIFAFGLYDLTRKRLILVRDHLGIKPLFYRHTRAGLFFGSEIKAVLAGANHTPAVRPESLQEYLIYRYVAGSNTFFDGIRRLPAAHAAIWEAGTLRMHRYWMPPAPDASRADEPEAATAELDRQLDRAVRMQLMSDVPLGSFCSGGLDSGLVTGYASRYQQDSPPTFSVGFESSAWDETPLARANAERFGTDHHVLLMRQTEFYPQVRKLIEYSDEPLSHPNSVPLYLLSRLARQHVTVVLTGEGSDELFAGYPRYHLARLQGAIGRVPQAVRSAAAGLLGRLPGHRAQRLADSIPLSFDDALLFNSAYVSPALVQQLTGAPLDAALAERRAILARSRIAADPVASLCRYELQTYLGCALDRMDRMSMANGLEARVPFLDIPLVEWGMRLPSSLKLRGRGNKVLVRNLAQRLLPAQVAQGRKSGFGVPLDDWFRSAASAGFAADLSNPDHPAMDYLDRRVLNRVVSEHRSGAADHGELLWLLQNFFTWREIHQATRSYGMPLLLGESLKVKPVGAA